jgi:hypothetical protein
MLAFPLPEKLTIEENTMTMLRSALKMIAMTLAVCSAQGVVHCAEAGSDDALIQSLCNEMNAKTLSGNVDRVIELTNPKIVDIVGVQQMREVLKEAVAGNAGVKFLDIHCAPPTQHSSAGGWKFALVPTVAKIVVKGKLVTQAGNNLATSPVSRTNWTFISLNGATPESIRQIFPAGIGNIAIPRAQ